MNLLIAPILTALSIFAPSTAAHAQYPATSDERVTVDYEVPVVDEALREFARFEIENYRARFKDDQLQVDYHLPTELTGAENHVTFRGPKGERHPRVLTGAGNSTMECEAGRCRVLYDGAKFDLPKREEILRSISKTEHEFTARLRVGESFRADPGGIVIFRAE
jgi:hypothetical protein